LITADSISTPRASIARITSAIRFDQTVSIDATALVQKVVTYLVDTDKVDATLVDADKVDATTIVAAEKHFRIPNPSDPRTEIWYSSVEGPEVAAYIRGTDRLVAGRGIIHLPKHFSDIIDADSMTVHLTPNSADSLGLAAVERSCQRIGVRELANGTGSYDFDYYVVVIRRGYADYEVVRPIAEND
jgi:hypothetical protein